MCLLAQGDEAMRAGMTAATPPWPVFHLDCRSLHYTRKVRPLNRSRSLLEPFDTTLELLDAAWGPAATAQMPASPKL